MSDQLPPDQDVRERFKRELDRNAVVEAGAGTGKTTLVVARIVALVLAGTEVTQLAAITFTDAAAAELKERVRDGLTERRSALLAGDEPRRGEDAAQHEAELARLDAGLAGLGQARISTIHGFCQRILREHALEAGLDPSFEVVEGNAARRLQEDVFDQWFDAMGADPAVRRALSFGVAPKDLEESARKLLAVGPGALEAELPTVEPVRGPGGALVELLRALQAALETYGGLLPDVPAGGRFYNLLVAAQPLVETHGGLLSGAPEELGEAAWSAFELELMQPRFKDGRPGGGRMDEKHFLEAGAADKAQVKATYEALRDQIHATRQAIGAELLAELQAPLLAFRREYQAAKERRAVLDFDDLLARAEQLVRTQPAVRRALFARIRTLFVDEFQDTDPIQARLVFYLAGGPGTEDELDWTQIPPAPGRLVLVGDPKQSIYRFRNADVETYRRCCDLVTDADPDARFVITTNFRTDGALVRFVNALFSGGAAQMRAPEDDAYQADYIGLVPFHAERGLAHGAVALEQQESVAGSDANLRHEAAAVVAHVRSELEGPLAEHGVTWGDVAILGKTHKSLTAYAEALAAAGIDYVYEGARALFDAREVQEALTLFGALVEPGAQPAVVGTLRSAWFGLPDDALVQHRLAGGAWDPLAVRAAVQGGDAAPGEPRVLAALDQLGAWAERLSAGRALVEELCFDGWFAAVLRLRPNGAQAVMDLQRLGGLLCELLDEGASLASAVRTCQVLQRGGSEEKAARLTARGAVRLMTVHYSKGLEFGLVVLAQPSRGKPGGELAPALEGDQLIWRVNASIEHPLYRDRKEYETPRAEAELLRLLYVAVTRAKHRLVLPVFAALDVSSKVPKPVQTMAIRGELGKLLATALEEPESLGPDIALERVVAPEVDPDAVVGTPRAEWSTGLRTELAELQAIPLPEHRRAERLAARRTHRPVPFGPSSVADGLAHGSPPEGAAEPGGQALMFQADAERAPVPVLAGEPASEAADDAGELARQLGTLVHACIEHRLEPTEAAERAAAAGWSRDDVAFVEQCVAVERTLPSHARAFAEGAEVWDELPIAWGGLRAPEDAPAHDGPRELVMNGFVDRLVRGPDGALEVIDFKTDRLVGPEEARGDLAERLAQAAAHHWVQLGLYGLALEAAGCEVRTLTLAFLAVGEEVSVAFDEAARERSRRALEAFRAQLV